MEISLDNMQVSFMTAGIKTASDSVSLTAQRQKSKADLKQWTNFRKNTGS